MALFKRRKHDDGAEMSFIEHLEVFRGHILRSVIAIVIGAVVVGIYNDFFIQKIIMGPTHSDFPTYGWLCSMGHSLGLGDALCMKEVGVKMQSTTVSGQFSMFFTVLIVGGLVIAFPYVFWEFWSFIKPGLTKKESSKTQGAIFWVSLLFFIGILFGYFVLAPYTVNFFANFQLDENIENRWSVGSYIDTLVPLILGTGLAFQLPLAILFLTKIGVVSPSYLRRVRKYAIVVIVIIAGVITPPDVISQVIVAVPLLLLYEVSILLSARVVREKAKEEAEEWS
jgi:sec-independent protein translocase protein TatC